MTPVAEETRDRLGTRPVAGAGGPTETRDRLGELAESCRACLQCGRCRSACPQGVDLVGGPRAVVRLIVGQDLDRLLACEDVWRCSECGACTETCPMGVDVAGAIASVRRLQQERGGPRCIERTSAAIATRRLRRRRGIDGLAMGLALAARGFLPRHPLSSARLGLRSLRGRVGRTSLPDGRRAAALTAGTSPAAGSTAGSSPAGAPAFFPGCALAQDRAAYSATCALVSAAGMRLAEAGDGRCCGHPSREEAGAPWPVGESVLTACPACERTLARSGASTLPIWGALVERAHRGELRLQARSTRFVPYAGCLSDRDATLAVMTQAAELAGAEPVMANPSLHAGCCGGLGGLYRTPSQAVTDLLQFAAESGAPIVTPCLLCRDVVRAAASRRGTRQEVHFWPEFFQPAPAATAARPPVSAARTPDHAAGPAVHEVER